MPFIGTRRAFYLSICEWNHFSVSFLKMPIPIQCAFLGEDLVPMGSVYRHREREKIVHSPLPIRVLYERNACRREINKRYSIS